MQARTVEAIAAMTDADRIAAVLRIGGGLQRGEAQFINALGADHRGVQDGGERFEQFVFGGAGLQVCKGAVERGRNVVGAGGYI